jgi:hypothetical protein
VGVSAEGDSAELPDLKAEGEAIVEAIKSNQDHKKKMKVLKKKQKKKKSMSLVYS